MPTLAQLHYIVTVDKLRHFGRAAKACHVTQPTLSMQIHKAEDELGISLFDRDASPVLPTLAGSPIIAQARAVLQEYERFMALAQKRDQALEGELHLGIIPTLASTLLPLFQKDFCKKYPKIELIVQEIKTETLLRMLEDDSLDAGLLATPVEENPFHTRVLFYEPFYVYASADHPYSNENEVKSGELTRDGLLLMTEGHCFRDQLLALCPTRSKAKKYGNSRTDDLPQSSFQFEAGSFETLRQLIRRGSGYTLFPQLFVDQLDASERNQFVRTFKKPIPTREISLIYRRKTWKEFMVGALAEHIQKAIPHTLKQEKDKSIDIIPV